LHSVVAEEEPGEGKEPENVARCRIPCRQRTVKAPEASGLACQVKPRDLGCGAEPVFVDLRVEVRRGPLEAIARALAIHPEAYRLALV